MSRVDQESPISAGTARAFDPRDRTAGMARRGGEGCEQAEPAVDAALTVVEVAPRSDA
ncbi:hypothetical protein [Nocardia xishanensis]|uniref:hypothetical protein n=1 Tax=Nocardia xishanensis TaxID=238964 RepID=UPI0034458231